MVLLSRLSRFATDQSGAVTVDWVVVTAAVAGLGLAAGGAVLMGSADLTTDISTHLSDQGIATTFRSSFQNVSVFDDFEGGNTGGWHAGITDDSVAFFGGILGRYGGTGGQQMVHKTYDFPPDAGYAVFEFDLHAIDTWDLETLDVFLNDQVASRHSFSTHSHHATPTSMTTTGLPNVEISYSSLGPSAERGYWQRGTSDQSSYDQSVRVRMVVANPGPSVKLGFGSTLNQSLEDESWAIDNVEVTATNDPDSA